MWAVVLLWSGLLYAEEPLFRVGVSVPLSGAFSEYGIAVRNGIQLALEEDSVALQKVQFKFEDDRYDPKLTVTNLQKFIASDQIDLFFVWGNEPALGAAPVAEKRKLPTVVVAQHPKAGAGYHYVIRFINSAEDYSSAIASQLRKLGFKRVAIVQSEISFFNILLAELEKSLTGDETLTIYEKFLPTDFDFRSAISKLKKQKFDALGVYLTPPQVSQFYKQAAEQGFVPPTFGTTTFESTSVMKNALGFMRGAFYSHIGVSKEFVDRYEKRFGDDVQISYAANAYDFAQLVGQLFGANPKKLPPEKVIDIFERAPMGTGASGQRKFEKSSTSGKSFSFEMVIKTIGADSITTVAVSR